MTKTLKLFVWEDVLPDATDGIAFALAKDEDQAWDVLFKADSTAWWNLNGSAQCLEGSNQSICLHDKLHEQGLSHSEIAIRPKMVTNPTGYAVWGGG